MNWSEERRPSPAKAGRVVGRVAALWRYPVKSMGGEMLDAVDVSWHGLVGDRRWAFLRPELVRGGPPWLTMSKLPTMGRYMPRFAEPSKPDESPVVVRTPAGIELDVADPALAAELGEGVRAVKQPIGLFDAEPLSILSTRTVADLGAMVGEDLDMRRFRSNIVVESDAGAYPEDGWVGAGLRIGSLRLRVDQRIERCVMVNIDPETSERDPAVLRAIASTRDVCLGIYAATVEPGRVAIGDPVTVEP
jgi:uncharacterized protein